MTFTNRLALPFIDAAQAQKHVTHNEALTMLDALVQTSVKARDALAPPATPAEGDRYLVGANAQGAFAGHVNALAAFDNGGWAFLPPRAGWRCYVEADNSVLIFNGANWSDFGLTLKTFQNVALFGLNASANAANPFAVKSGGALFAAVAPADGGAGDFRLTLNKSGVANTVSQIYQTNWSGRAETGLTGDDRFHIKVSADGALWREALSIDPASGLVVLPQTAGAAGGLATLDASGLVPPAQLPAAAPGFRNRLRNATFAINQRCVSGVVTLAANAYGHDGVKAGAGGATYTFSQNGIDTTLAISAGSLIMPVEAAMMEGGVYTVSHAGTAKVRVWQGAGVAGSGAYSAAPFATAALAANTQTNVEFSGGAILRPQFEPGGAATPFERRPPGVEWSLCQRYFQKTFPVAVRPADGQWYDGSFVMPTMAVTGYYSARWAFAVPMRVAPTLAFFTPNSTAAPGQWRNGSNSASLPALAFETTEFTAYVALNNANPVAVADLWYVHATASAEL
ncbi:MAG: DUF2793 domain-containing protein [Hyphomicrobiales bacterium]|nr:DUF2793 domain-containing protein [Hyphomicrobiales bacterium]